MVGTTDAANSPHAAESGTPIGRLPLLAGILVPPTAWSLHIVVDYVLTTRACSASDPNVVLLDRPSLWPVVGAVHLVTLALIGVIGAVAYRDWRRAARPESDEQRGFLMDVGEGEKSFLAHWGLLMSLGFFVATLFDTTVMPFITVCG
ncbi:MAG: hypothetical protein CMM50_16430 [Rhodospirillaceae bacterium]|nr:hypothetical protein [Rhodospirillaceae bacterium]